MHTKGNWIAKEGQVYPEETGKTLALIPYFDEENKEDSANANLIAAAPELLAACALAITALEDCMSDDEPNLHAWFNHKINIIRSAVNKAQ
jgi:hypothetical protein